MKLILMFLTITSFSIVAAEKEMPNLAEKGNANAGSNLVATCAACHGSDAPNKITGNIFYRIAKVKQPKYG